MSEQVSAAVGTAVVGDVGGAAVTATPVAATTATTGTSQSSSNPAPVASDWTSGFSEEVKGWVQNKGFADPSTVIDSYRNFEKLMGVPKERLLKLPENAADPAAMAEIYNKLGRPADAKDYKIELPKEGGDAKLAEWARGTFHKLGLTAAQAESLANEWTNYSQGMSQAQVDAQAQKNQVEEDGLKKKWGAAFDQNVGLAKRAMSEFGIDGATIDKLEGALGFSSVMELLHKVGSKVGEANFVTGHTQANFGVLTPDAAMNKLAMLKSDPSFVKRYTSGDATAIQEMNKLHQMAYPS